MEEGTRSEGNNNAQNQSIDVDAMQKCIASFRRMEEANPAVSGQINDAGEQFPQDGQPSPPTWSMIKCGVSHSHNSEWHQKMLERAKSVDLGAWQNDLYLRITGATAANFHEHPRVLELGLTWQKTWQDDGRHVGNVDATEVMCSSVGEEPMRCSNFDDVPDIVKEWLDYLWKQQIPRTWRRNKVASISIEELRKGQLLNTSAFVIVTHGYLAWKERRVDKNGAPFLMCRLTDTRGLQGVLFFIFQKEFIDMIEQAPLQSMIGLCGLESVPKKGYSNRAYSASGRIPGAAVVLKLPEPEAPTPGKKRGRPPGSKNKTPSDLTGRLLFVLWKQKALTYPGSRTDRHARSLAQELQTDPKLRTLPLVSRPTKNNILRLWKSGGPKPPEADNDNSKGNAKPRGKQPKTSKSLNQDDTMDQTSQASWGDEQDRETFGKDSQENYTVAGSNLEVPQDPLRLAYANYLAHTWLPSDQKHLCPVFKDEDNVVFCIPSMSKSSTKAALQYGGKKPVFIHIGKIGDEEVAVVCSQCDKPRPFWPKERFLGTHLTQPSLGFQHQEENADIEQGAGSHKKLCPCAWALLQIPNLKSFISPTKNIWDVVELLHDQNREWPVVQLRKPGGGVVTTTGTTYRQHPPGWLIQVGRFGDESCAFVQMTTRGKSDNYVIQCTTCTGHKRCNHELLLRGCVLAGSRGQRVATGGQTAESYTQVLEDYTTGAGVDLLKLWVKSTKEIPDVPEIEVQRLLNATESKDQVLYQLSEQNHWTEHQKTMMKCRRPAAQTSWVPVEGLRDRLEGGPNKSEEKCQYAQAALFHIGGVVPARIRLPYDGNDDAVINVDDKCLFTWELVRKYLLELRTAQTNFSRFVSSMQEIWVMCIEDSEPLQILFPVLRTTNSTSTEPLKQLRTSFSHAVHGYITLLHIDWNDMFRCRCEFVDNAKGTYVYDNACNVVVFAQNRDPKVFDKYAFHCDNFHHKHGSTGKGHRNCGPGTNMVNAGIHNPEYYHGNMIEQKNSRVRALEALVSSESQPRMMNTFRYYHAQENKKQMAKLQHDKARALKLSGIANDLLDKKQSALWGLDAVNLPQGVRHSFLQRPWEHPRDDCARRWGNRVTNDHRQMLGNRKHRKTLSQMLALTESDTFKEFSWDSTHTAFVDFVKEQRPEVLWLIRFESKNEQQRLANGLNTEELWEAQNTQELKIEDEAKVRFSCECLLVRNVLLNWSARNPEVQFCFPIWSDSLKTLLEKDPINLHDLKKVREISGQHVRNILEFDQHVFTGGQSSLVSLYSLSQDCRSLLRLILRIVDESLKTKSAPIEARDTLPIKQILKYADSESWLLTGEWFPHNPVRRQSTGSFVRAKRYLIDEKKNGSLKPRNKASDETVCHKKLYAHNNLKPGLLTVHCLYCCVNVGFSFLEEPETVRTCYNLFWHRKMLRGDEDETNEEEEPEGDDEQTDGGEDQLSAREVDDEVEEDDDEDAVQEYEEEEYEEYEVEMTEEEEEEEEEE